MDLHVFADPDLDPGSQNVADQADPNYGFYIIRKKFWLLKGFPVSRSSAGIQVNLQNI